MLEEFNIEDEAGGVNKPIIKRFPVKVIDNTLNIRFYWAGKGTMDMPVRGVYGPLISAISVDPGKLAVDWAKSNFRERERERLNCFILSFVLWKDSDYITSFLACLSQILHHQNIEMPCQQALKLGL